MPYVPKLEQQERERERERERENIGEDITTFGKI
jgi:hypothetical protein